MLKYFKSMILCFAALFLCVNVSATSSEDICKLAEKLKIESEQLQSLLTSDDGKKGLVPLTEDYENFYLELFSNEDNAEHMKYYGNGNLSTKERAQKIFEWRISRIWDSEIPSSLSFIIMNENKPAGFVGVGPLNSKDSQPEIGRVIDKKVSGKGLGTFSAQTIVRLLQYLKNAGIYNYTCLISTSKPENLASRKSIMKAGFVTDEKIVENNFGHEKIYKYEFK